MMAGGEVLSDQQQWDLLGLVRHVNSWAYIGPTQSKNWASSCGTQWSVLSQALQVVLMFTEKKKNENH